MAVSPASAENILLRRSMSIATAPELQEYVLQDVTAGEHVGDGAYGFVTKLDYNGTLVAGKTLHMILLHAQEGNLREKFVHECRLLKDLRHPHVVQFLGICFLEQSMPVLVMEFLPYNLHDMLVEHPRIHLAIKLSLLKDITCGLTYLHSQNPSIVHRDLSARNVLLNSALVAKIADFGVARIIDPHHLSRSLTSIPGAGVYMPPESAHSEDALTYTSKLDIFSFGVLLLFVITQEFPKDPLPPTYIDENELKPRNELQRREPYMTHAEEILGDAEHPLLSIVRECLSNVADRRPTAVAILESVKSLQAQAEDDLVERDKLQMIIELQRLTTECEELQRILYEEDELGVLLAEKERQIGTQEEEMRRLNQSLTAKERELHSLQSTITHREREKAFLEEQLQRLQSDVLNKESEVTALREMLRIQERDRSQALEGQLTEARRQVESLQQEKAESQVELGRLGTEVERKEALLDEKREEVLQLKYKVDRVTGELNESRQRVSQLQVEVNATAEDLRQKDEQLGQMDRLVGVEQELEDARREITALRCENAVLRNSKNARPPPLSPEVEINLPLSFSTLNKSAAFGVNSAKAVMFGTSIVVAGGNADVDNQQQVMYYKPAKQQWGFLGRYNLSLFGMAVLGGNRMLVLVGGYDITTDMYSNDLVMWDHKGKYWKPTFRPMPTARSDAAAVGYKGYLVVAGGSNGEENLTVVEVLNTHSVQWSQVTSLPAPIEGPIQSVSMEDASRPEYDTWYLMGWETGLRQPPNTFSISLHELVQTLEGGEGACWSMLPKPPLACCGAVIFRGCLLAVGGQDKYGGRRKEVHIYFPGTCEWRKVADLPVPKYNCCCFSLSSEEFLVIGGTDTTQFSTRVEIARGT